MDLTTVIDLTNSERYYQKADFQRKKVNHYKLAQAGKEAPTEEACQQFCDIVFHEIQPNNKRQVIGVHCTHGINRTGFMLVYLLMNFDLRRTSLLEAICMFEKSRGHRMTDEN